MFYFGTSLPKFVIFSGLFEHPSVLLFYLVILCVLPNVVKSLRVVSVDRYLLRSTSAIKPELVPIITESMLGKAERTPTYDEEHCNVQFNNK